MSVRTSVFILLFFFGGANFAAAQTGSISGTITMASDGAPVHGAVVTVAGARRTATSREDGKFEIANVPAGTYDVVAQRQQLATARQSVVVQAGAIAVANFTLEVGAHEELTVTASATGAVTTFESFSAISSLDSTTIAKKLGATIADVLQDEPGIAKRTFGPGSSRPIIRGFDGDRVLIMQDGIRTGDLSSQSGDHGVSIDPSGLSRIEVVKGPATLLYGSNAIGGVVNAITPQDVFRTNPFSGTLGGVNVDGGSANGQAGIAANVQHGRGPLLVFGSFTSRRTGDYRAPELTVDNSATQLNTGEGGVAWTGAHLFAGASAGIERNRYGIPFAGFLEGGEDSQIDLTVSRQNLRIDAGLRNLDNAFLDNVKVTFGVLDYKHDELEIEDAVESLGTRFTNRVITTRLELEQKRRGRWSGRMGAELFTRDYEAIGEEALAPKTSQSSAAAFVYEELRLGAPRLQFGGRIERTGYDATPEDAASIDRRFNAASGSLGLFTPIGEHAAFVVNLTGASRAPALEELFNFGPHPGNLAFEVGNDDLRLERSVGVDASLRARGKRISGELSAFTYAISNFVFLDLTEEIEDGLRVGRYEQGDSRFTGFEASGHADLGARARVDASMAYVRATLTSTGDPLPRIPPFHGRVAVSFRARAFEITPDVVFSARQDRVFRDESETGGYATINLGATWQLGKGHASQLIAVQAYNLGNTTYRLHTSFLKDLAPEVGRGVKVTYSVRLF